ncbi:MAG TPA: hypothetical protein VJ110_00225 [Candidatus Nanoarchaeia archaeon]|nr:hypothetical protein [Candidatus Nanoarchaeia archaeon]
MQNEPPQQGKLKLSQGQYKFILIKVLIRTQEVYKLSYYYAPFGAELRKAELKLYASSQELEDLVKELPAGLSDLIVGDSKELEVGDSASRRWEQYLDYIQQ